MSQLTIELSPELERRLSREAEQHRLPVEDVARTLLEDRLGITPEPRLAPLWQRFVDAGHALPEEVVKRLPEDGARNLDHYLYGSPKVEP